MEGRRTFSPQRRHPTPARTFPSSPDPAEWQKQFVFESKQTHSYNEKKKEAVDQKLGNTLKLGGQRHEIKPEKVTQKPTGRRVPITQQEKLQEGQTTQDCAIPASLPQEAPQAPSQRRPSSQAP